jgi:nucleotide-binding universal stress UspA family protein
MNFSILVLTGFPETAAHPVLTAAALGGPVPLVLLHVEAAPVLLEPELVAVVAEQTARIEAETMTGLRALAGELPLNTVVVESVRPLAEAVGAAVARYQPLLLVMGLSDSHTLFDKLLRNYVLPVLRATHRPLLLVPTAAVARRPLRVLIAVDGEPFTLTAEALALAPLLATWAASYVVAHVAAHHAKQAAPERLARGRLLASGLLPPGSDPESYEMSHLSAGSGVVQAITDTRADLVVVLVRPRCFLERRFHRSVTAQVLRHSRVPVLLVPGKASDMPGWMPKMS